MLPDDIRILPLAETILIRTSTKVLLALGYHSLVDGRCRLAGEDFLGLGEGGGGGHGRGGDEEGDLHDGGLASTWLCLKTVEDLGDAEFLAVPAGILISRIWYERGAQTG